MRYYSKDGKIFNTVTCGRIVVDFVKTYKYGIAKRQRFVGSYKDENI